MGIKKLLLALGLTMASTGSYANSTAQSPSVCREIYQIFVDSGLVASEAVNLTFQLTNQVRSSLLQEKLTLSSNKEIVYSTDAVLAHLVHRLFEHPIDRNFLSLQADSLKFLPTFQKHQALVIAANKKKDLTRRRVALVLPYLNAKAMKTYIFWGGRQPIDSFLANRFDVISLQGEINPCTRVLWRELKQRSQAKGQKWMKIK